MFRKYERTFRIKIPEFDISSKHFLSHEDTQKLLTGKVTVEEKIDGANVGIIITHKPQQPYTLQKRGSLVDTSEHPQFNRFKAWANERYDQWLTMPKNYIIYGEFMWATHHLFYDQLPDWFICFDIFDKSKQIYISREERENFCDKNNIQIAPLLFYGNLTKSDLLPLIQQSKYSSTNQAEGLVIKNNRKQMRGKLVRPEFIKEISEDGTHWTTKWDSSKINQLSCI